MLPGGGWGGLFLASLANKLSTKKEITARRNVPPISLLFFKSDLFDWPLPSLPLSPHHIPAVTAVAFPGPGVRGGKL